MKVAVLGAGRVGRAMALDLAKDSEFEITVVDRTPEALTSMEGVPNIGTLEADLSDQKTVRHVMKELDGRGVRFQHQIEEVTG